MPSVSSLPTTPGGSDRSGEPSLADFARRVEGLYTLPGVAARLIELTDRDDVAVHELQQCIQHDPAISARVLRVVNSSLFGLSGQVTTLNQAVALLGIRPLKLLVLAFCLPEQLFVAVAGKQLELFWRQTVVRAVAARDISERFFRTPGDEAFLAGLLHDLGILVLLGQLGEPYAAFFQQTLDDQIDLAKAESEQFGFNHRELAGELLTGWKIPAVIVEAIAGDRMVESLARRDDSDARLAQVLHLADMFSQLVANHRISVLPCLTEAAVRYCGMSRSALHNLVGTLEDDVQQLAAVLATGGEDPETYHDLLVRAQQQIARLIDQSAASLASGGEPVVQPTEELLDKAGRVRDALAVAEPTPLDFDSRPAVGESDRPGDYLTELTLAVGGCRALRQPLSVAYLAVEAATPFSREASEAVQQILRVVCRRIDHEGAQVFCLESTTRLLVLPDCERHEARAVVEGVLTQLRRLLDSLHGKGQLPESIPSAGVASVGMPPKNFLPQSLFDTARRCQAAARRAGGVKSLEVS